MKKITLIILCFILVITNFTACSSNNVGNQNNSNQKIFSYLGNNYPVNVLPNFEVKDMEYSEEDSIIYLTFSSENSEILDNIENYDFSNGNAEIITYIYNGTYNDLFNEKCKILGSFKYIYYSNPFDGCEIIYAPDGNIVYKNDLDMTECGLYRTYFDKQDNIIAKYFGYDEINKKSLWKNSNDELVNEDELKSLLENLCPNEYLMGII